MDKDDSSLDEEDGYLCTSCLRFFALSDVSRTWTAGVAMSAAPSHGCRLITEDGGYICQSCSAENLREMEEKARLLAIRQEAARQRR